MSGTETMAYTVAGIALAFSCVLFILSSRTGLRDATGTMETEGASHPATLQGLEPRQALLHRLATWVAAIALLTLGTGLALRGMAAKRWPLGSPFEFTLAFAACVVLMFLCLHRSAHTPMAGAIPTLLALALMVQAFFVQPEAARAIQTLPPVMRGIWFSLHTLLTAISYGALAVAGSVALGNLVMSRLPVAGLVDWAMDAGYVALSLGMIAGGIWSERAWGEYWSWSIKEIWTLITWWVCTFYDHVRQRRGWRGRRAMGIAVLALVAVLVTFFFTPTMLNWTRLQRLRIY
jgi:ABC-type transport system involved in cytochrome c biogenesis permease subunit